VQREAFEQLATLDQSHWGMRGRRAVYLGLLDRARDGRCPARALDLGCGPGGFLSALSARCERVIAADFDTQSLASLAERDLPANARGRVQLGCDALPFCDAAFELVCLYDVLEHLDDDLAALREIRRVLAPGGLLALSVPAYPWLFSNNDRVVGHRRRYTRASLRTVLQRAGFKLVRNTHANVLLAPLIIPVVLASKALEALSRKRRESSHTNLSWRLPRWVHAVLTRIFSAELLFTARFDAPFGHSLAALARRED
jgi:SAM-dependent methyltransferase